MKQGFAPLAVFALVVALSGGCKKKATAAQCDELLDHYAALLVHEKHPDAKPDDVAAEQAREREAAARDDDFKNCTTELSAEDFACAMHASTSAALEKCLE